MVYRTRTYIAADWDHDFNAVEQLRKWNDSGYWSLSFTDAHELHQSRDTSKPCNIKASLRQHMDASKRFVLIVGDHTDSVTKGGCQWCDSYYQGYKVCDAGRYVTFVSYIEYECRMAREAGIKIVVLYNSARVNKSLCPEVIRDCGVHAPMKSRRKGYLDWDYQQVKMALGK